MKRYSLMVITTIISVFVLSCGGDKVEEPNDTTRLFIDTATVPHKKFTRTDTAFVKQEWSKSRRLTTAIEVAEKRSADTAIKTYANLMVKDYTSYSAGLARIAKSMGFILHPVTDNDQERKLNRLLQVPDKKFDPAFVSFINETYKQTWLSLQQEVKNAGDSTLKSFSGRIAEGIQKSLESNRNLSIK